MWWDNSNSMTPRPFDTLYADMLTHAAGRIFSRKIFTAAPSRPIG